MVAPALGREREGRLGDPVVGPRRRDTARGAGGVAGDPPRQVVGLAAGVHQEHPVEPSRQGGQQSFGQLDGGLLQIAAVGVERGELGADRVDDRWVRVSQHRHVVVGIEVAATVGPFQEQPPPTHEMHRLGVAELQPAEVRACVEQVRRGSPPVGEPATDVRRAPVVARRDGREPGCQCVEADVEHGLELAVRLVADLRREALLPGPPSGDQDGRGVATGHQVSEKLDLLRLQRGDGVIARQDLLRELQVGVATEHVRRRHRQVADQSRVGHVPEVGDAGDRQRLVDEDVGGGQVVVHDLGAQPEQLWSDSLLEAVEHRTHGRTLRLLDRREPRSQLREASYVPGDRVGRRRVYEAAQRLPEARRGATPLAQLRGPQLLRRRMPAVQPRHHPRQGATTVQSGQHHPPVSLSGRHHVRHRYVGCHGADVAKRRVLEVQHLLAVRGVVHLQQVTTGGRVDPEVPVTFPVHSGELPSRPQEVLKESCSAAGSSSGTDTVRGSLVQAVTGPFWRSAA